MLDSTHGWAVGASGAIVFYNGSAWATQTSGTTNNLKGVFALDSTHVWAVGASGTIRFYNGASWAAQTSNTTNNLEDVYCLSSSQCWAVGASGTIMYFNGTTWAAQTSNTTNNMNGIYCLDSSHCWAVGNAGTVDFYNGSTWATQTSGTTNNMKGVFARDAQSVWAVSDNNLLPQQTYLTQNGGTTWITTYPQDVEFTFTPTIASGTAVTSVQATIAQDASANPAAGTVFWLMASPDDRTSWKYFALPAATTTTSTPTVDLTSLIDTTTKVDDLVLRYYVEAPTTAFAVKHDFVQVQVN
jgi:hypothetical protein